MYYACIQLTWLYVFMIVLAFFSPSPLVFMHKRMQNPKKEKRANIHVARHVLIGFYAYEKSQEKRSRKVEEINE